MMTDPSHMTNVLQVGDQFPAAVVYGVDITKQNRPILANTGELFRMGLHAVLVMPLAASPTCSGEHLPGLLPLIPEFLAQEATLTVLTSSDTFATGAWIEKNQVPASVRFFCDPNRNLARALPEGLRYDRDGVGNELMMRAAMVVEAGTVKFFAAETGAGNCTVSAANPLLDAVRRIRAK